VGLREGLVLGNLAYALEKVNKKYSKKNLDRALAGWNFDAGWFIYTG
jgi:hypothetical protein